MMTLLYALILAAVFVVAVHRRKSVRMRLGLWGAHIDLDAHDEEKEREG